ncbi:MULTISPECIES: hypothetical protein [Mycobacterium]|uniref:Uncharacterized protein n=1 Tax=Mycobacterium colombiense TaxID=339268 RepID=A0A329LL76_9MYCO|nr:MULTISPECIES: hypothetical protein [Mycobacterium]MDM4141260.1 hypothetical protein [Mycobacterium sp. FLAC0960]RAV04897.1 hypothetical protein DQP57_23760 [Mycobacterium colombiense]
MSGTARSSRRRDRVTTRLLVSAAVLFGTGVLVAAPAGADPSPFGTLSSSCNETAPAGRDALIQGIRRGITDWSPGAPHTSARTTCAAQPPAKTG